MVALSWFYTNVLCDLGGGSTETRCASEALPYETKILTLSEFSGAFCDSRGYCGHVQHGSARSEGDGALLQLNCLYVTLFGAVLRSQSLVCSSAVAIPSFAAHLPHGSSAPGSDGVGKRRSLHRGGTASAGFSVLSHTPSFLHSASSLHIILCYFLPGTDSCHCC